MNINWARWDVNKRWTWTYPACVIPVLDKKKTGQRPASWWTEQVHVQVQCAQCTMHTCDNIHEKGVRNRWTDKYLTTFVYSNQSHQSLANK